jgi:hypothetical protein
MRGRRRPRDRSPVTSQKRRHKKRKCRARVPKRHPDQNSRTVQMSTSNWQETIGAQVQTLDRTDAVEVALSLTRIPGWNAMNTRVERPVGCDGGLSVRCASCCSGFPGLSPPRARGRARRAQLGTESCVAIVSSASFRPPRRRQKRRHDSPVLDKHSRSHVSRASGPEGSSLSVPARAWRARRLSRAARRQHAHMHGVLRAEGPERVECAPC